MDPRLSVVGKRLSDIDRVIVVGGGKGGVGKTVFSSALAYFLSKNSCAGLFDCDFTNPTSHVVLGVEPVIPEEEGGILPVDVNGLSFMSLFFYSQDLPLPLRGWESTNVFLELVANTLWGDLGFLIFDLPPGITDTTLDVLKFLPNPEFFIVTTPSLTSRQAFVNLSSWLDDLGVETRVVFNMVRDEPADEADYVIPFDSGLEDCLGSPEKIVDSVFGQHVCRIAEDFI